MQRDADLARLPQSGGSLVDQLAAEAAARPKETPTLEALTDAVAKQGVSLAGARQAYGRKQLALYCGTADGPGGLVLTVCEYPDDAQAARGEAEANVMLNQVAGHQSRRKKKSVLHVVARSDTPADVLTKVLTAFEAL